MDAPLDSDVFNTEHFGPMAALRSVKNLDEAIAEANRLPYGLSAYAFTSSIKNAHRKRSANPSCPNCYDVLRRA